MREFYLNLYISFPDLGEAQRTSEKMREREKQMGYSPTRRLLQVLKGGKHGD